MDADGGPVGPSPETRCDAADDDGDGRVDEGLGVGDVCPATGLCGEGVLECGADGAVVCSTHPGGSADQSTPERCDGQDHDCDGRPLNGMEAGQPCVGVGACGNGITQCFENGEIGCSSDPGGSFPGDRSELCNGRDDDCDGSTDEDFQVGEACEGVGACGAGVFECVDETTSMCSTDVGGSADGSADAETCDGTDEDCDGLVDEDFAVGATCDGEGACGPGLIECVDAESTRCSTDPGGSMDETGLELCDAADNDCDGLVDEGYSLGEACEGAGECTAGIFECHPSDPMMALCSTDPGGSDHEARDEVCDGADNDCDGTVDDGDPVALCIATPVGGSCVDGACTCPAGTFDLDRAVDGCECTAAPVAAVGASCAEAIDLGDVADDGDMQTVSGNVLPTGREVWYRFRAVDLPDTSCDNYHVRAWLRDNPDDTFEITAFRNSCATPVKGDDSGYTDMVWATDFRATVDGRLAGECPCTPSGGSRVSNRSPCQNNSATFFLRVRRRDAAAPAACTSYTLEISNGVYDWS